MGQVTLAQVVCIHKIVAVVRVLVLEDTGAAVALHLGRHVKGGEDVLRGEHAEVVGGQGAVVEQVAGIFQLRIRRLGIEGGEVVRRVAPGFQRLVEGGRFLLIPAEPVQLLRGRSGHAQPGGPHVFPHEGEVVEVVIGGGVPLKYLHLVVQAVVPPGDQTLELQGIRQEGGLQHAGRVLDNAVLDALEAVLAVQDGILAVADGRVGDVLVGPALALGLAHGGPFLFPGGLGCGGGIGQEEGIYPGPEEGVSFGLEGVHHQLVGIAVLGGHVPLVEEGVGVLEAVRHLHGVPGEDLGHGVLLVGEEVEVFLFQGVGPIIGHKGGTCTSAAGHINAQRLCQNRSCDGCG